MLILHKQWWRQSEIKLKNYDKKQNWFKNSFSDWLNVSNQKIKCKTCSNWNQYFTQEHNNFSNTTNDCISHGIWPNQVESIISSHTEVLSSDSDLNVSSLVDELNNSFNTSKTTSDTVDDVFETFVLVGSLSLSLLFESFNK